MSSEKTKEFSPFVSISDSAKEVVTGGLRRDYKEILAQAFGLFERVFVDPNLVLKLMNGSDKKEPNGNFVAGAMLTLLAGEQTGQERFGLRASKEPKQDQAELGHYLDEVKADFALMDILNE